MARLDPEQARRVAAGFPRGRRGPYKQTWRDAPSVVGRGDWRCGICQEVLDRDADVDEYEGERCHVQCIVADQEAMRHGT